MSGLSRKLISVAALAMSSAVAHADVLNFDDLSGYGFFLSNYQGFKFGTNSIATTAWFHTNEVSPYYKPHSGTGYVSTDFQLYNGTQLQATQAIGSAVDFTFDGAWFSGFEPIAYKLYNNSVLVYSSTPSAPISDIPVFIASGYAGLVDEVVVLGTQGYYAMDDFTFNSPVPEVGEAAMFALGLLALGCFIRNRAR